MPADLDRAARSRLRTLEKDNSDAVARHLVMAGRLLDDDPELAYAHVQEAVRRAGRVDVVREAAGITAYRTGRYAEALRELRTARRLNGSDEHVPLMADCERGLGRPERALALADEHGGGLPLEARVELAIVVSGARLDMDQPEAAVAALNAAFVRSAAPPLAWRVAEARAEALRACGRNDEADQIMSAIPEEAFGVELIEVMDLDDEADPESADEAHLEEEAHPEDDAHPDDGADPEDVGGAVASRAGTAPAAGGARGSAGSGAAQAAAVTGDEGVADADVVGSGTADAPMNEGE